jgi:nicotinate-nucleotide pyrophosphorylase (carboxylating)
MTALLPDDAVLDLLAEAGLDADEVLRLVRATLAEDLGEAGDLTSLATVPADAVLDVRWVSRGEGVVAGLPVLAALVAERLGRNAGLTLLASDGDRVHAATPLAALTAPARDVLALERTSLNLLGHLSGVATATRAWADAVEGTGARVRDTRKTMPLLRSLEKYAVRCGGGVNHRAGLYDAVLVKDNHLVAAGGIEAALRAVRESVLDPAVPVQVEVDTLDQLDEALTHGATQVLLDNMDLPTTREAVRRTRAIAPGVLLESSGGLTLESARAVAETGVDLLAVGALTHSAPQLDIGLDAV